MRYFEASIFTDIFNDITPNITFPIYKSEHPVLPRRIDREDVAADGLLP